MSFRSNKFIRGEILIKKLKQFNNITIPTLRTLIILPFFIKIKKLYQSPIY
jgi:hypothetical protein